MHDDETTEYNDETQPQHDNPNSSSEETPQPSEYDKTQDARVSEDLAAKDEEIAKLREELATAQNNPAPDQVVSVPGDEAQFHEVPAPGTDAPASDTLGTLPLGETPTVEVEPVPELSDTASVDVDGLVKTQEDLKTAVAEILVLVQEIHETVVWVRTNVPAMAQGLQDSPLGKMLPSFFATGRTF